MAYLYPYLLIQNLIANDWFFSAEAIHTYIPGYSYVLYAMAAALSIVDIIKAKYYETITTNRSSFDHLTAMWYLSGREEKVKSLDGCGGVFPNTSLHCIGIDARERWKKKTWKNSSSLSRLLLWPGREARPLSNRWYKQNRIRSSDA